MIDNTFQVRYKTLPIAVYTVDEPALEQLAPFMLTHHHSEFEVIAILKGSCKVIMEQTTYTASAGDIFFIPPYTLHSGCIIPGQDFAHVCFCFDLSILCDTDFTKQIKSGYLDITRLITKGEPISKELFPIIVQIYKQCTEQLNGWKHIVQGLLLTLVGMLEQSQNTFAAAGKGDNYDFGTRVLELLNQLYHTELTSRDMANHMCYSQSYFCRVFRETFLASFQQYLCQFRLCKAKMLLTQRDVLVNEVAVKVGFNNISYFSKQFKLMQGCTPKQFQLLNAKRSSFEEYYFTPSVIAGCAKPSRYT